MIRQAYKLVLVAMSLSFPVRVLGQRHPGTSWSLGGYGSVLHPGTGHAPSTPPGRVTGHCFPRRSASGGNTSGGWPAYGVIVPAPIYAGDDAAPGVYTQGYDALDSNSTPPVLNSQDLTSSQPIPQISDRPAGVPRRFSNLGDSGGPVAPNEVQPTIYLIALKDHTILQALGYWMEDGILHYVSSAYGLNQISVGLIDLELSQRLNNERKTEFSFPILK